MISGLVRRLTGRRQMNSEQSHRRRPRFEHLEDRRLLAMADVLFLIDESLSNSADTTQEWVRSTVAGLQTKFSANSIDAQYGLVGFGQNYVASAIPRYSHSQLLSPPSTQARLFGTSTELFNAFANLRKDGGDENGWDAIEHAIAEYTFRDGAVPLLILVQNDEGRISSLNPTLTHEGVLASLNSKNALLNTMSVGNAAQFNAQQFPVAWRSVFDLSGYGLHPELRIFGVEADAAGALGDGQHVFYSYDVNPNNGIAALAATSADALQLSFNGSNTGATGLVGSGKSTLVGRNLEGGIGRTAAGYSGMAIPYQYEQLFNASGLPLAGVTKLTTLSNSISLPFSFSFYAGNYTQVWANEDGTLSFTSAFNGGNNVDLSDDASNQARPSIPIIAPLWDQLKLTATANTGVYMQVAGTANTPERRVIVEWHDVAYNDDDNALDLISFQAVLYADGRIQFNYKDLDSYPVGLSDADVTANDTGGINATVGVWSGAADLLALPAGKYVPGAHSVFGANDRFDGQSTLTGRTDTNDNYIRMAWDTGGAAWDIAAMTGFATTSAQTTTFLDSLKNQVLRNSAAGKVFRNDVVVRAVNLGSLSASEGFAGDVGSTGNNSMSVSGATTIDVASNSIPLFGSPASKVTNVFRTARKPEPGQTDVRLSFTTGDDSQPLKTGLYVVELYFAELNDTSQVFDVQIEGRKVLNDYSIFEDRARIVSFGGANELDVEPAGLMTTPEQKPRSGVVKRFQVDVSANNGAAGLQIDLIRQNENGPAPLISGVRILNPPPPRVTNVSISNTSAVHAFNNPLDDAIDYDGSGLQLRTVPIGAADTIRIDFDEPANVVKGHLTLTGLRSSYSFDLTNTVFTPSADRRSFTWKVPAALTANHFLVSLSDLITDDQGNKLDGEWVNPLRLLSPGATALTQYYQQLAISEFPSGNGIAGGGFNFVFTILPGDANLTNVVDGVDLSVWIANWGMLGTFVNGDFNGNGQVEGSDYLILQQVFGTNLQRAWTADFNSDGVVNSADYTIWITNFGITSGATLATGDADGDGDVDGADFTVWQLQLGIILTWA